MSASSQADVQARLDAAAVEHGTLAIDVGSIQTHAQADVISMPCDILVAMTANRLYPGLITSSVRITRLCERRQTEQHA